ncbi:hypothetical protein H9Q69_009021 [Fusarium xylarioides]|uniref:Uncharacterized protein n=1 Tax=Fusarium xylarioides TaxID=221167 RepID=A0A9P7LIN8_9HYPO|nr:hypothetical protein H9Q70_011424 [Fusarium xylarioides]KAG5764669.1 hypothetical protein H9Q72_007274 [Fusarium xylarioides]KAG5775148.1 hypothetical protein H9Q73_011171 [Fusarium xylarioides]KAG5791924.1 hypothetical protein H9Q69_009021 [Fusarium xylarioides]KAG5806496.1 hypothetical protein H9Q71_008923 [Fusarium xylarioides]
MNDSALFTRFADRLSLNREWIETTQSSAVDGEMCLSMALFSHIERLKIQIADDQIVGHTRHFELLYSLLENDNHEEIFPKVRYLDIDKTQCTRPSLCDPEIILLLRGTPHLQRLILRGSGGETFTDQNSDFGIQEFCIGVKDVIELQIMDFPFFKGTWQVVALERILGATQNLETFKFVFDDYSCWYAHAQISPAQLIEFLNPQTQKTLQRLSLNFDSRTRLGHRNLHEPQPITPHQIKQFTNLITLEVDSSCYYSYTVQRNNDEVIYEQDTYLVNFLPQTVENLTIFFNRSARYDVLDDITYLGQQTVAGDFPSLKRVQIDAPIRYTMPGSDSWDNAQLSKLSAEMNVRRGEFQRAFVGSGVDAQFRTWYVWE